MALNPTNVYNDSSLHAWLSSLMAEVLTFFTLYPNRHRLALIKTLWLMGEHIKLFSPHRLQPHKVILVTLNLSQTGVVEVEPAF